MRTPKALRERLRIPICVSTFLTTDLPKPSINIHADNPQHCNNSICYMRMSTYIAVEAWYQ